MKHEGRSEEKRALNWYCPLGSRFGQGVERERVREDREDLKRRERGY